MMNLWPHQNYEVLHDGPARALFWEQGTGKTRAMCALVKRLFDEGKANAACIVVPNGLETQWKEEFARYELNAHIATKNSKIDHTIFRILEHLREPVVITTYSYISTIPSKRSRYYGWERVLESMQGRKLFVCLDESARIKNPKTRQAKSSMHLGHRADIKRILDGTPVDTSPMDIHSQLMFLDRELLVRWGVQSAAAFRKTFFNTKTIWTSRSSQREVVTTPKNLGMLKKMLSEISSRYRLADITDLPPVLRSSIPFELSPAQRRDYREIENELMLLDEDFEAIVLADFPIVLAIRLAQITCGFVGLEDGGFKEYKENPRLEETKKRIDNSNEQWIVWTRFIKDIKNLQDVFGDECVKYDGSSTNDERRQALEWFKNGHRKVLLANTQALAFGHNLQHSWNNLYYSYTGSLRLRRQSEARTHRAGQEKTVLYVTMEAAATIDQIMLGRHQMRREVSKQVMGDAA